MMRLTPEASATTAPATSTAASATTATVAPAVAKAGTTRDLTVTTPDGRTRTAHLYVPASLPDDAPVPLLVALHGGTGSGRQFERQSNFDGIAEANRFLVVYPDGIGSGSGEDQLRTWNGGVCCGAAVNKDVDDVTFLRQLVEQLSREYDVDAARVFATGHSNGMIMSYRLVCEAADVFVAAAGQAGTLGVDACDPAAPISFLHIHGAADTNIPIDGGRGQGISGVDVPIAARQRAPARRGRRVPGRPGHDDRGTGDHRDVGTVRRRHRDRVRDRRGRDPCVDGRRSRRGPAHRCRSAGTTAARPSGRFSPPTRAPDRYGTSTAAPRTRSCARSASATSARSSE